MVHKTTSQLNGSHKVRWNDKEDDFRCEDKQDLEQKLEVAMAVQTLCGNTA